jgi:membrane protease YdiL (CAAX protease family)
MFIISLVLVRGREPIETLLQNLPALIPFYLSNILFGILIPSLGEETGWRGIALPRLQTMYGALTGSLILGSLHALWHLPAYFIQGAILPNGFDLIPFLANSCAIVAALMVIAVFGYQRLTRQSDLPRSIETTWTQ